MVVAYFAVPLLLIFTPNCNTKRHTSLGSSLIIHQGEKRTPLNVHPWPKYYHFLPWLLWLVGNLEMKKCQLYQSLAHTRDSLWYGGRAERSGVWLRKPLSAADAHISAGIQDIFQKRHPSPAPKLCGGRRDVGGWKDFVTLTNTCLFSLSRDRVNILEAKIENFFCDCRC